MIEIRHAPARRPATGVAVLAVVRRDGKIPISQTIIPALLQCTLSPVPPPHFAFGTEQ
jgi:hypothetical protein